MPTQHLPQSLPTGVIDYGEYERLMNMEVYGDDQGGNFYVRQALDLGILKKGSVLEDCVMVGNKGFDPLGLARTLEELDTYREAEIIKGQGDATAADIYGKAYGANPEFFAFHRSMQAYRRSLGKQGDVLVISPDGEFFDYLKESGR